MTADPKLAAYGAALSLKAALWALVADGCCEAALRCYSRARENAGCAETVRTRSHPSESTP